MSDKVFAVIDTNVLVSALISKTLDSNTVKVFRAVIIGRIIPLFNDEILNEYRDVLTRSKFNLNTEVVENVIKAFKEDGLNVDRVPTGDLSFPDPKDIVFYEVSLSKEGSYLVTGNIRHFPATAFVVTPAEMIDLLSRPV